MSLICLFMVATLSGGGSTGRPLQESRTPPPFVQYAPGKDGVTVSVRNDAAVDLVTWHVELAFRHSSGEPVRIVREQDYSEGGRTWSSGQGPIRPGETRQAFFSARDVAVVDSARVVVAFFDDLTFYGEAKEREVLRARFAEQATEVDFWLRGLTEASKLSGRAARTHLEGQLAVWGREIANIPRRVPGLEKTIDHVLKQTFDDPSQLTRFIEALISHLKEKQTRLTALRLLRPGR